MTKPLLIVRNDANEGAGLLETLADKRRIHQHQVFGSEADFSSISTDGFSGLVVLGGAQSAYETDAYPYLLHEMDLCESFLRETKPIIGFCLGAQILATTLGGRVMPGQQKEIGWFGLSLTSEGTQDPIMRGYPEWSMAYHFHGDFIVPPRSCVTLAASDLTSCQLFRHESNVYGFQYHAEVDMDLLSSMCRNNASYLAANALDAELIIKQARDWLPDFERNSQSVLDEWLDLAERA